MKLETLSCSGSLISHWNGAAQQLVRQRLTYRVQLRTDRIWNGILLPAKETYWRRWDVEKGLEILSPTYCQSSVDVNVEGYLIICETET